MSQGGPITCPQCGARNPPTATWCSLCHTRFDEPASAAVPAPRPAPGDQPEPRPEASPADTGRSPAVDPAAGTDPDAWAALLAAEEGRRASGFEQAMGRRGTKVLFIVAAISVVLVATALVVAVLTGIGQ